MICNIELNGRSFTLVGTAHVSKESIKEVEQAVETQKADNVAVELDSDRMQSLENRDEWSKMDIIKVLKNRQGFLLLANILLAGYQKKTGEENGVRPGDEMAMALHKAQSLGIQQTLIDRPVAVTLKRAWRLSSPSEKLNVISFLLASLFTNEKVTSDDIEKLKQNAEMDNMLESLGNEMPGVKKVLIEERDRYLASKIWECKGNNILAVVGAGHVKGICSYLEQLSKNNVKADCSDIEAVPEKKKGARIAGWIIPLLIIALIVTAFILGGKKKGWDLLSSWVIWNGALAAIGSLIAGAHPLTVAVSFIGAPFTSLCPLIGVGIVAGIVQAFVCKPKVKDMENLQSQAGSVKGWYKNRITRVLLVFIFSSLGSSLGTFIAGSSIVASVGSLIAGIVKKLSGGK